MIDFKLIKIKINNFACYYGENEINFNTPSKNNLFLFKLRNGYGKTSFFHAFKWGFYGESLDYYKDSRLIKIKDFLNDKLNPEKDSCSVEITFNYGDSIYILKRIYEPYKNNKSSRMVLDKNGLTITDNEKAVEELNQIIPKNFADFFMFDGEQLSQFMSAQKELNYKESIHQLLGLKQLRVLRDDLMKLGKEYDNRLIQSNSASDELEEKKYLIKGLMNEINNNELKIKNYEEEITTEIKTREGFEDHLKRFEKLPKVMDDYKKLVVKTNHLVEEISFMKNNLILNSKKLFTNFIKKDLSNFLELNNKEIENLKNLCGLSDLQARTQETKNEILSKSIPLCDVCGHKLSSEEIKHLKDEQKRIKDNLEIFSENKNKRNELIDQNNLFQGFLNQSSEFDFQKELDNLWEKNDLLKDLNKEKNDLEKETQKSKYGELGDISRRITSITQKITTNEEKIKSAKRIIQEYDNQKEKLNMEIKRLGHDDKITNRISSTREYITNLSRQLNESLNEATLTKRKNIIKKSNEIFNEITNKPDEYSGLDFKDDESYSFVIKMKDGNLVLNPSKGENQILAMSFLLGLNQYTGINNLILMDTPVASLDDIHSAGIGKALAKLNNQIIFLAQPQELSGEIYENIKPAIAKEFTVERLDYRSKIIEVKNK